MKQQCITTKKIQVIERKSTYSYTIIYALVCFCSLFTTWYSELTVILVLTLFISIADRLGKTIILLDTVAFLGCFICLFMPVISYKIYNRDFLLARLFRVYMHVPEYEYFTFALPAMAAFTLAITWPMKTKYPGGINKFFKDKLNEMAKQLANMPQAGIQIVIVGFVMLYVSAVLPQSLRFFGVLFYFSSFAGLLYVYFGPVIAYKPIILITVALFTIGNALQTGMFTVLIYMSVTLLSFFFIGSKLSFIKKLSLFIIAIFLISLLQSVKSSFRKATWKGNYQGSKAMLFQNLVSNQLGSNNFLSKKMLFGLYMRSNQGVNISLVMNRIPARQPFDNGTYIIKSAAAAFVPRLLWPDKPEAGGVYNMKHYAGIKIKSWSTNIGPLGEAYGNFGVTGGIIYMFFLGMFIRFAYKKTLQIADKIPLILLWIPLLFYQTIFSMETDTLQILNSLIKSTFFIWLLKKILPDWFGRSKATISTSNPQSVVSSYQ